MKMRRETGLSALELTVVVLIIGLIASVALPNVVAASRSYRLQIATRALAQQLNTCRQKAVTANQPVSIQVTATESRIDTNRNGVFGDAGGSGLPADEPAVPFGNETAYLSGTSLPATVTFTSRGELPLGAGARTLTVRFGSTAQRTISIDTRGAVTVGPEAPAAN
jgi:Tfp pilus assembly protein FimT